MKNLKSILDQSGISQRELARRLNITPASCCRYVNNEQDPRGELAIQIAKVLNVSFEGLYGDDSFASTRPRKCKYCDLESEDYMYSTFYVDLGILGDYELAVYVSGGSEKLGVDFGSENDAPAFSESVKIKYCPYCGARLGGEAYER